MRAADMRSELACRIDRAEVLRCLGHAGQQLDASLNERVDAAIALCERVSTPAWTYQVFPVEFPATASANAGAEAEAGGNAEAGADANSGTGVCLAARSGAGAVAGAEAEAGTEAAASGGAEASAGVHLVGTTLELSGADIAAHLAGARECAVMAATVGLSNERELQRLTRAGGLDGVLFDAAGSVLAEAVADACNAAIADEARRRGLFAKWRFSPGYGDLPLSVQPAIVRVLSADRALGLTTTDAHMLVPTKSVTAIVGLFDTPQAERRSCTECAFAPNCAFTSNCARAK